MLSRYDTLRTQLKRVEHKRSQLKKRLADVRLVESTHGKVIGAALALIEELKRPIRGREVFERLKRERLGRSAPHNKQFVISAVLSQEIEKKSARLKRVDRGLYYIK